MSFQLTCTWPTRFTFFSPFCQNSKHDQWPCFSGDTRQRHEDLLWRHSHQPPAGRFGIQAEHLAVRLGSPHLRHLRHPDQRGSRHLWQAGAQHHLWLFATEVAGDLCLPRPQLGGTSQRPESWIPFSLSLFHFNMFFCFVFRLFLMVTPSPAAIPAPSTPAPHLRPSGASSSFPLELHRLPHTNPVSCRWSTWTRVSSTPSPSRESTAAPASPPPKSRWDITRIKTKKGTADSVPGNNYRLYKWLFMSQQTEMHAT